MYASYIVQQEWLIRSLDLSHPHLPKAVVAKLRRPRAASAFNEEQSIHRIRLVISRNDRIGIEGPVKHVEESTEEVDIILIEK